jgi:MOSC domain-containing protein YiiM
MKIISIQVGKPKPISFNQKIVETAIYKDSVNDAIQLNEFNLEGDQQADLINHGGRDKALYAYGCDAYPAWKILRPNDVFSHGSMGENLSLDFLPEDSVFIGDIYQIGNAEIQVAQPRFPCFKLGVKFKDQGILKQFMKLGRPGVYFRVVKEGQIKIGDELQIIKKEAIRLSIGELFLIRQKGADITRIKQILRIESLPENWREELLESLSKQQIL